MSHRFQHLGSGDHRFALEQGLTHQLFLYNGNALDWYFNAKITAGDHDSIGNVKDIVNMVEGTGPFNFGNDKGVIVSMRQLPSVLHAMSPAFSTKD